MLQNHIYARIDAMFAGAGAYATLTVGGLFAAEGFGTHLFSGGGTGANALRIRNTTAGTGNYAQLEAMADSATKSLVLGQVSTTFTTAGDVTQDGAFIRGSGPGGISISASNAVGEIRFYSNAVHQMTVTPTGVTARIQDGSAATPAIRFASDTDTGLFSVTSNILGVAAGGVSVANFQLVNPVATILRTNGGTGGAGTEGAQLLIGANTDGSGATGSLAIVTRGAATNYIWPDSSASPGVLRIHTAAPTEDNTTVADTAGTIVGTQTSWRRAKHLLRRLGPAAQDRALSLVTGAPIYEFEYRDAWKGHRFVGIVTDETPEFGYDADPRTGVPRAFNPVSATGYLMLAVQALTRRVTQLERQAA